MPICKFLDVLERDMDMLFLEELVSSNEFLDLFLSQIGIEEATIVSAEHSKKDNELGESDMTVGSSNPIHRKRQQGFIRRRLR